MFTVDDICRVVTDQIKRQYVHCPHCGKDYCWDGEDFELKTEEFGDWEELYCHNCDMRFQARGRMLFDFDVAKDAKEAVKISKDDL